MIEKERKIIERNKNPLKLRMKKITIAGKKKQKWSIYWNRKKWELNK